MAIAFGAALGTGTPGASPTTTVAFNTTATVPANGRLVVGVGWYNNVTTSISGGGLSWAQDRQTNQTIDSNRRNAVHSAHAPSGLASGTTITATASGNAFAFCIAGCYITGAPSASYEDADQGNSSNTGVWSTGNLNTTGDAILIAHAWYDGFLTTSTTTAPATEFADFQFATDTNTFTMAYRVFTGAQVGVGIAGTWGTGATNWVATVVAYKADVAVPPNIADGFAAPAGMFSPRLVEKGWYH